MPEKHFINLSNGIEFLPTLEKVDGYIRIQSTACEQKLWWSIICDLDYTFLFAVANGDTISVYDCSAHKKIPRAIYQGLEWLKYVLNLRWKGHEIVPMVKGNNCQKYFNQQYYRGGLIRDRAFKKLDYVSKFTRPTVIDIRGVSKPTDLDGNYIVLANIMKASKEP